MSAAIWVSVQVSGGAGAERPWARRSTNSRRQTSDKESMSLEHFTGTDPAALDPVFLQLVRNLTPGQAPVIRIGGGSTDHTWLPVAHMRKPGGVSYAITRQWLSVAKSMAHVLNARMIF